MLYIVLSVALWGSNSVGSLYAQDEQLLAPYSSVNGTLNAGESAEWRFSAVDGEVVSLVIEASGGLDPVLTLISETGATLLINDDYEYPVSTNAVLQAISIPFTGTYTARISALANTSGTYTLSRYRGFAAGFDLNGFSLNENWTSTNEELALTFADNQLTLALSGVSASGVALDENAQRLEDFFAQVDVEVSARGGWLVQLNARQESTTSYYAIQLDEQGRWRVLLNQPSGETVLKDWALHPAIRPAETRFSLAVLANGNSIEAFYNGNPLGQVVDPTLEGGVLGLGVRTASALDANINATFSNLRITVPLQTSTNETIIPERLIIADPQRLSQSLERQQLIPTGGALMLNVAESSAQHGSQGISRLPLGRGTTYANFVMSTEVQIQAADSRSSAACGIYFRAVDDENYTLAYVDRQGGYGLEAREGTRFLPGLYQQREAMSTGEHHLLVIANEDKLYYYIDGFYVGVIAHSAQTGSIGNAVVNFESEATLCNFQNTWLWTWN